MDDARVVGTIDLAQLRDGIPALTPVVGACLAEAGIVCFEDCGHLSGVLLAVRGSFDQGCRVMWPYSVDERMRRCWNDAEYTTEQAAYGVAILLVRRLTGLIAVKRARKGGGFDYWLAIEDDIDVLPFQDAARLEVTGIRRGDAGRVRARLRRKRRQVRRSDGYLPAYIAVVEFGEPSTHVERKE